VKKILVGLALVAGAAFVLLLISFWRASSEAQSAARALCDQAIVGGPVEGLEASAKALGLRVRSWPELKDPSSGQSLGPGKLAGSKSYSPVGGFGCEIIHADGKVTAKQPLQWD